MRKLSILLLMVLCLGCASQARLAALEKQVAELKRIKSSGAMLLAEEAGSRKFWWRNALTGAPDGLDQISTANLADGDAAFVMTLSGETATGYLYIYDADGTHSTDSPTRIVANGAAGAWHLVNFNVSKITSDAAAGYHYINVTNAGAFSGTPSTGDCYYRQDTDSWCCYDGGWLCEVLTAP